MFSLMAPVAGYAAVKVGERVLVVAGAIILTVSMLAFTQLGSHPSQVAILVALALSGVGIGLATPTTVSASSNEVAPDELGVMSAAQQLITQIGIVTGIQVMVTVQASGGGGRGHPGLIPPGLRRRGRGGGAGRGLRVLHAGHPEAAPGTPPGRADRFGRPWLDSDRRGGGCRGDYSVMARIRAAISAAAGSGVAVWRAISLAMSPSTLILPDMKAWMPACGLPSTRMALATS